MAWTEYLVGPYVCMYACMYVHTRATVKSYSPILPNFTCRISLWCRCAPSTFFHEISSLPVFISTSALRLLALRGWRTLCVGRRRPAGAWGRID